MTYRTLKYIYLSILIVLMLVADIKLSFATEYLYGCFILNGGKNNEYKVSFSEEVKVETYLGRHVGTGWAMTDKVLTIMDKSGKNGVKLWSKTHNERMEMSKASDCAFGACLSKDYQSMIYKAGYFVATKAIGKGLNIRGCSNVSSPEDLVQRVVYIDKQRGIKFNGLKECCRLHITS